MVQVCASGSIGGELAEALGKLITASVMQEACWAAVSQGMQAAATPCLGTATSTSLHILQTAAPSRASPALHQQHHKLRCFTTADLHQAIPHRALTGSIWHVRCLSSSTSRVHIQHLNSSEVKPPACHS